MTVDQEWFVYALYSQKHNRIYIGMSQFPEKRLTQHNNGQVKSTKAFRPWVIIFKEKTKDRSKARKREVELKTSQGRRFIRKLIAPSSV